MGRIVYTAAASQMDRLPDFRDYFIDFEELTSPTTATIRFRYDAFNLGGQDPDLPETIVMKFDNIVFSSELDEDGEPILISADFDEMRMVDQFGNLMVRFDDPEISPKLLFAMLDSDQSQSIYQVMGAAGNTFIGGLVDDGDRGSQINTGFGDDTVMARSGRDTISDGGGSDHYDGGTGQDTIEYSRYFYDSAFLVSQGIVADLAAGTIVGPDGNIDTVTRIENVDGSFLDDVMLGDARGNEFAGMQGNDSFDGRGGFDLVTYSNEENQGGEGGIVARMGPGIVIDSYGDIDTMVRIEGVEGTDFNDRFFDSARDDYMEGDAGADRFAIAKGNDYIRAGDDNDADLFVFRNTAFDHDRIRNFDESDGDTIQFKQIFAIEELTITTDAFGTLISYDTDNTIYLENVFGVTAGAFDFADLA